MLLLKKLGASLEEQIAGLLHDIPHTAFSHTIDFVFPNKDHNFHERFHEKIIKESEIPEILERYGFVLERLLNEHNFPLLEKKLDKGENAFLAFCKLVHIFSRGLKKRQSGFVKELRRDESCIVI